MTDLDGELHWHATGTLPVSRLAWRTLSLYGLQAGASRLAFTTGARSFELAGPTRIPVFDGALAIQDFAGTLAGADAARRPVRCSSTRRSSRSAWRNSRRRSAGRRCRDRCRATSPACSIRGGTLSIAGDLTAQVFDGRVTVSKLMLQDPLGAWPRFSASITARNLDLDQVTHTFPIGGITGRLDADIGGLELFD
ncbi:MAG: hypothetical protein QM820_39780 [Minicystis sp.]